MMKVLLLAALLALAVRWATGRWPWAWLSPRSDTPAAGVRAREARARRLLGVPPGASAEDIRAAYRRLAPGLHPDRGGSGARLAALTEARDLLLAHLPEPRK